MCVCVRYLHIGAVPCSGTGAHLVRLLSACCLQNVGVAAANFGGPVTAIGVSVAVHAVQLLRMFASAGMIVQGHNNQGWLEGVFGKIKVKLLCASLLQGQTCA